MNSRTASSPAPAFAEFVILVVSIGCASLVNARLVMRWTEVGLEPEV